MIKHRSSCIMMLNFFSFYIIDDDRMDESTWRERLIAWKEILRRDKITEQVDSLNANYVVDFDMEEVEKSLRKEVVEKSSETDGTRALWISKRWWRYRPKLPYTYFLNKLDCSEVYDVQKSVPIPLSV